MGIEALKTMKDQIVSCVQGQLGDLSKVDAKELGEAMDMIKDLSEAIYYCTITQAMEKADEKESIPVNNITYYTTPMHYGNKMYPDYYRDAERSNGYMYYTGVKSGGNSSNGANLGNDGMSYYTEMMRDPRQGRSPMRRRMYMQGKETHNDPKSQLKELEAYLQQLSTDITEMIKGASPQEKATLHKKMTMLTNKIV